MKKYLKVFLSLIMVFALTGCVKYHTNMEVKDDKSVTLEIVYALDTTMAEDMFKDEAKLNLEGEVEDEEYDESFVIAEDEEEDEDDDYIAENESDVKKEDYEWLEKKGYKVEEFEETKDDHKYVGVKLSKKFKSIDDISKEKEVKVDFVNLFNDEEKFDDSAIFSKKGDIYKANFLFDFSVNGEETSEYDEYQAMFDLKYTIKLPHKAKKHNATKVSDDGKTLTWNLKYGKKNKVEFEFGFKNNTLLLVVGAIAIVIIIVGVVMLLKNKKKAEPTA